MSSWVTWALWVPSGLLFILLPGCLSLSGPSSVKGTIGGSVSIRCTYEKNEAVRGKFWCIFPCLERKRVIMRTSSTEQEVRKDHVTIRDDPASLTFTVSMEHLRRDDAGKYACGITGDFLKLDSKVWVEVTVFPASQATSASPETSTEPALSTSPMITQKEAPDLYPSADPEPSKGWSLLCSIHLRILVFLKVPVLLGLMGPILWVRWHQRAHTHLTPLCDGQWFCYT